MRQYEITILVKPEIAEKELDKISKDIQTLLTKIGGEIKSKTDAQKKKLAYELAKVREAYYLYFEVEIKPEDVKTIEDKIKLQDNIIRYLIVAK